MIKNILPAQLCRNYMDGLVGRFFKILPLKEEGQETLGEYIDSLLAELSGCTEVIAGLEYDGRFLSLIATLEYLRRHIADCETAVVRREIFKSIATCKKLRDAYGGKEVMP